MSGFSISVSDADANVVVRNAKNFYVAAVV